MGPRLLAPAHSPFLSVHEDICPPAGGWSKDWGHQNGGEGEGQGGTGGGRPATGAGRSLRPRPPGDQIGRGRKRGSSLEISDWRKS